MQFSKNHGVAAEKYSSTGEFPGALVGLSGLEPLTLRLSSACSNQLSYRPMALCRNGKAQIRMVELRRFELLTYSLQSYRSTN